MGSLFKQKAPPPPPPIPPTYLRDEVNNVEQVPVTNADGSVTYVTRKIPLSAEEQAQANEIQQILDDSLSEIVRLSDANYTPGASTQKSLDAWEALRKDQLDDTYTERTLEEEKNLARRGLGDSAAAESTRRRRRLDRQEALTNLSREREALIDDLRQEDIGLQQNLYNIASSQQDAQTARQVQAASQGQRLLSQNNQIRQASLLDYYNAQLRQSMQPSAGQLFLGTFARAAGSALGSGLFSSNKKG